MNIIEKARNFAIEKHAGQLDDAGKPYFDHCQTVADLVSIVSCNPNVKAAAYIHDIVENTPVTYAELIENFGLEIADLVMEVTHEKINGVWCFPRLRTQNGIILKFMDRGHNLSRMEPWTPERRMKYIKKSQFWKTGELD